jgi:hypothetical protein
MAEESVEAGVGMRDAGRVRAATSRLYYAAYQAAHAIVATTPIWATRPTRGNWHHPRLANAVCSALKGHLGMSKEAAKQVHNQFQFAMNARVVADYKPFLQSDDLSLEETWRAATNLLHIARKRIGGQ